MRYLDRELWVRTLVEANTGRLDDGVGGDIDEVAVDEVTVDVIALAASDKDYSCATSVGNTFLFQQIPKTPSSPN